MGLLCQVAPFWLSVASQQHSHLSHALEDKRHRKQLLFCHGQSSPTLPAGAGGAGEP